MLPQIPCNIPKLLDERNRPSLTVPKGFNSEIIRMLYLQPFLRNPAFKKPLPSNVVLTINASTKEKVGYNNRGCILFPAAKIGDNAVLNIWISLHHGKPPI